MATIIDGNHVAQKVRDEAALRVVALAEGRRRAGSRGRARGRRPGLGELRKMKERDCASVGTYARSTIACPPRPRKTS